MIGNRKMIARFLITAFTIPLSVSIVFAGPIINQAPSTMGHGSKITISGSGFGGKAKPTPQIWETWENGNSGQTPNQVSAYWSNGDNSIISENYKRHEYTKRNVKLSFPAKGGAFFYKNDAEFDKYYINFWVRWNWVDNPANVPTGSIQYQIKFFRLDQNHVINADMAPTLPGFAAYYPKSGGAYVYWQTKVDGSSCSGMATQNDGRMWTDILPTYGDPRLPLWLNLVVLVDQSNMASTTFKIYASDLKSVYEIDQRSGIDMRNLCAGRENERFRDIKFGGSVESGGPEYPVTLYYDDIYIDNSWSRVEIGDKSSYNSCTHREVQIPSEWSTNTIQFTSNRGSFNSGTTVYLYVSDANGNVNSQGFPIKLDSTTTSSSSSSTTSNQPPPAPGKPFVVN